jgi:hypothetical protein
VPTLTDAAEGWADALERLDPASMSGNEAASVVELCCRVTRLAEAAAARFGRRVEETGAFAATGHRSAAEWLGERAKESPACAKSRLTTAALVATVPALDDAFRRGVLSADQARVIAPAAVTDPCSVDGLLETAAAEAMGTLRERALAVRQRAYPAARRADVHRRRYLRCAADPRGGVRGSFLLDETAWGRCLAALEPLAERRFAEGRRDDVLESRDAYMADALVTLCTRPNGGDRGGPSAMVQLRVDVESLRRGRTDEAEVCEIVGVGPVPVAHARSLLGDVVFDLLVHDGQDVRALTGEGRSVPKRLRTAIERRDQHCRWGACRETKGLQLHHWRLDAALGEVASLETLVTLCQAHHDYCTYGGWRIEPRPAGGWRQIAPDHPPSARFIERKRKLAARRAAVRRH